MKKFKEFFNIKEKKPNNRWQRDSFQVIEKELTLLEVADTIIFRRGFFEDIDGLLDVERLSYHGETPWNRRAFEHEMRRNKNAIYLVLVFEYQLIGFIGAWFVQGEAHITNIAIIPKFRNKGLASFLIKELVELAIQKENNIMSLEVRTSNTTAQSVYRKMGFVDGKIKKAYYASDLEDALEMSLDLRNKKDLMVEIDEG
ncbi:ribosomal protein S18-alanine N-acetyltransferase [Isobaculum melis]|uniref:Ribosomal-protein-alanine N-acetyltransferase n=1 Tax=Isobaculum melis TaxID=142588 RepID=A0A1H9TGV9_9LACT|nr:ribosomal protein S18-alanine N-acetyltransferase [Isobaculum melis]SER96267.1 ribosomal-protein-alanine N-acetyltransferase [Isobaculum melis]